MSDAATTPGWNGWGNGVANTRFAPGARADRRRPAAAQVEMGVRLRRRERRARAAGDRGRPSLRRQRERRGARARSEDRLHALDVQGAGRHPHRSHRSARTRPPAASGQAVYFGDAQRQRLRRGRATPAASCGCARWTTTRRPRSPARPPCHGGKRVSCPCRGSTRKARAAPAGYPVLHVPRQPRGARRQHGRGAVEDLHRGRRASRAARTQHGVQMCGPAGGGIWSSPTVDTKRGVVYVATGNGYADPPQKMTDARRGDGHADRRREVGEADDGQRQLDAGLPAAEPGQPGLSRHARPRLRLLGLAVARHRERPRPAGAAAEVRHGVRARPRQERRRGLAAAHRPGQRPRRPVGRRRGRAERLLRRVRHAVADPRRDARREPRHRRDGVERRAAEAAVRRGPHVPRVAGRGRHA